MSTVWWKQVNWAIFLLIILFPLKTFLVFLPNTLSFLWAITDPVLLVFTSYTVRAVQGSYITSSFDVCFYIFCPSSPSSSSFPSFWVDIFLQPLSSPPSSLITFKSRFPLSSSLLSPVSGIKSSHIGFLQTTETFRFIHIIGYVPHLHYQSKVYLFSWLFTLQILTDCIKTMNEHIWNYMVNKKLWNNSKHVYILNSSK